MEKTFKLRTMDKVLALKFKINYWLLCKLGLWGYGTFAFLCGCMVTVILYEFVL